MSCQYGQSLTAAELYNKKASAQAISPAVVPAVAPDMPAVAASSLRGSGAGRPLTPTEKTEFDNLEAQLNSRATLTATERARYEELKKIVNPDVRKSKPSLGACSIL
jgi:hypothetical protein